MSDIKNVNIRGLIDTYEFKCVLPGSGQELKIKPITTGQMKKILAYEGEEDPYAIEEALDNLITSCVLSEGFDVNDLYLQDRFYLLVELRKVTKGNMYSYTYKCPACGKESVGAVDISQMKVVNKKEGFGNIKINDRLSFNVDFPKRKDQKAALRYVKSKGKMTEQQRAIEVMTTTLAQSIVSAVTPDGVVDNVSLEDRVYILDNIKADIFDNFKKWFDDNEFGMDFRANVKCAFCDNEQLMEIPLSDFFG